MKRGAIALEISGPHMNHGNQEELGNRLTHKTAPLNFHKIRERMRNEQHSAGRWKTGGVLCKLVIAGPGDCHQERQPREYLPC